MEGVFKTNERSGNQRDLLISIVNVIFAGGVPNDVLYMIRSEDYK